MRLLQNKQVLDANSLDNTCRGCSKAHHLILLIIECGINAKASSLVQPIKVEAFVILLRNLDNDGARLEQMDLIDQVTSLNDQSTSLISFRLEVIHQLMDDVVFNFPEVWHVLYHSEPELKIKVIILSDLLSKLLENDGVLSLCLEQYSLAHR